MGAREFSLRDPMVFVLYGVVLAFIVALSLYYMLSAFKRAKELGIESSKIKKVITTSATFSSVRSALPSPQSDFPSSVRFNTKRRWQTALPKDFTAL